MDKSTTVIRTNSLAWDTYPIVRSKHTIKKEKIIMNKTKQFVKDHRKTIIAIGGTRTTRL